MCSVKLCNLSAPLLISTAAAISFSSIRLQRHEAPPIGQIAAAPSLLSIAGGRPGGLVPEAKRATPTTRQGASKLGKTGASVEVASRSEERRRRRRTGSQGCRSWPGKWKDEPNEALPPPSVTRAKPDDLLRRRRGA